VAESPAKGVKLGQNARTTNALLQQWPAKMYAGSMAVKVLALNPKLADNVAPNPVGSTEMKLLVCAWSAA